VLTLLQERSKKKETRKNFEKKAELIKPVEVKFQELSEVYCFGRKKQSVTNSTKE
jgi:uncharacterized protein YkuJ